MFPEHNEEVHLQMPRLNICISLEKGVRHIPFWSRNTWLHWVKVKLQIWCVYVFFLRLKIHIDEQTSIPPTAVLTLITIALPNPVNARKYQKPITSWSVHTDPYNYHKESRNWNNSCWFIEKIPRFFPVMYPKNSWVSYEEPKSADSLSRRKSRIPAEAWR